MYLVEQNNLHPMGGAVCVYVCVSVCVCAIDHPNRHTGSVQRQNKEVIRKFPCLFFCFHACINESDTMMQIC